MATDLATLEVLITSRGGADAQRALEGVAQSGTKAEAATSGLTQAQSELIARSQQLVQAASQVSLKGGEASARLVTQAAEVRTLAAQYGGLAEAEANAARVVEVLNQRTRAAASAQVAAGASQAAAAASVANVTKQTAALGAATGLTQAGLNSMRASLTSMAAAALSTAPGVAQLGGVIGTMALGSGVMVGVLAGIAALSTAYEFLTRKTREAKEAADAFAKTDAGLAARSRAGAIEASVSGGRPGVTLDIVAPTKELEEARKALKGFQDQLSSSETQNIGIARFGAVNQNLIALRKELASGSITVEQFERDLSELDRAFPGFEKQIQKTRELGELADAAARQYRQLTAAFQNARAESDALTRSFGQQGVSVSADGQAAARLAQSRQALAVAQSRAAAAQSGGTLGVQDFDAQHEAVDRATADWATYVTTTEGAKFANLAFTDALAKSIPVAQQYLANARAQVDAGKQAAATLSLQADLLRDRGELAKLQALNGAYRESEVTQRVLGITIDATNQKEQNRATRLPQDAAKLNAVVDATTKARVAQVLLNDSLERENRLRSERNANAGALEAATNARDRAALSGPDAELQAVRDRAREEVDAENRRFAALQGLTATQRATEQTIHAERLANIQALSAADLARIKAAREETTRERVTTTVRDNDAEAAGIRAMSQAELEGARAVEAMRVQLAGEEAVRRAVNDAIARGTMLSDEQAAAIRRSAEEVEAARVNAERLRQVYSEVSGAASNFFRDTLSGKNPLPGLANAVKEQVIRGMTEAAARPITVRIAKILGIEVPEDKQLRAARDMNSAADKMLRAAEIANGQTPSGPAPGGTAPTPPSAAVEAWKRAMGVAAAGVGGYGVGYGLGQTTGSGVIGAVGGAIAGAKLGSAFGAPGAIVGAVAGFAGGIIGAGDAAREAAAKLEAARKAFHAAWETIVADINGDDLAKQLAGVGATFDDLRQKYLEAGNVFKVFFKPDEFKKEWADLNQLEQDYIEKLKREAAFKAESQIESYRERELRAQGKTAEADELGRQQERAALIESFGKEIDATERQILAALDGAQAAERNTAAINSLTTSLNTVTGFKLDDAKPYIQEFAKGRPYPGTEPLNPLTPSGRPNFDVWSAPTAARLSSGTSTGMQAAAPITVNVTVNESKTPQLTADAIMNAVLTKVDIERNAGGGLASSRSAALDKMKLRPGAIPWRS